MNNDEAHQGLIFWKCECEISINQRVKGCWNIVLIKWHTLDFFPKLEGWI